VKKQKINIFSENAGFVGYTMSTILLDQKMFLILYFWHKGLTHLKNGVKANSKISKLN